MKTVLYCVGCYFNDFKIINFLINENRKDVLAIVSDKVTNITNFKNISVLNFDKFKEFLQRENKEDFKIVVFYNTLSDYNLAVSNLQKLDLAEFENFVQYNLYNKKMAIYWECNPKK